MANVVKETNLKSFEWNATATTNGNLPLKSESFSFNQQTFNLILSRDYNFMRYFLYLESDKNVSVSTKVILNITSTTFDEFSKMVNITSRNQEIWRSTYCCYQNLSLRIEVIMKETETSSTKDAPQGKISPYLEQNIHFRALSTDFSKLLKEADDTSDVTITCEGKIFRAHKNVLQTRSAVLSAMLKSGKTRSHGKTGLIKLKDVKLQICEHFLRYLYTGSLPNLTMDTVKEFYKVGDQYVVKELKNACSEFMTKNLTEKNACELLVLADLHSDKDFQKKVISYIVEKKIPKRDSKWSDFCKSHSIMAVEVLNLYIEKHCID